MVSKSLLVARYWHTGRRLTLVVVRSQTSTFLDVAPLLLFQNYFWFCCKSSVICKLSCLCLLTSFSSVVILADSGDNRFLARCSSVRSFMSHRYHRKHSKNSKYHLWNCNFLAQNIFLWLHQIGLFILMFISFQQLVWFRSLFRALTLGALGKHLSTVWHI